MVKKLSYKFYFYRSVKNYTGLPSKSTLNGLFSVLDQRDTFLKYWSGGKKTAGTTKYQEKGYGKTGPSRSLTRYQEFILTLVRLRLGILGF